MSPAFLASVLLASASPNVAVDDDMKKVGNLAVSDTYDDGHTEELPLHERSDDGIEPDV